MKCEDINKSVYFVRPKRKSLDHGESRIYSHNLWIMGNIQTEFGHTCHMVIHVNQEMVTNTLWPYMLIRNWYISPYAHIQSTLVISNLKGPSETLRDIRTSTYQIFRTEENTNRTTKFQK